MPLAEQVSRTVNRRNGPLHPLAECHKLAEDWPDKCWDRKPGFFLEVSIGKVAVLRNK